MKPDEANQSILQYVSKDKKNAVVFQYNLAKYPNNTIPETQRSPLVVAGDYCRTYPNLVISGYYYLY
jgi:hypothetical protein